MNRLLLAAALAALASTGPGCSDEKITPSDAGAATDALAVGDGGADAGAGDVPMSSSEPGCFEGTPRTHQEFLDSCWPETVSSFSKRPTLPGGYLVGQPLPAPPPP